MLGTWILCPACIACLNDVTAFTAKELRLNSAKWDALHTVTAKCRELQACSSQLQVKILLGNAMDHWCPFLIADVYIECSSSFKAVCGTEAQCVWLNSCSSLLSSLLTKQSTNKISTFLEEEEENRAGYRERNAESCSSGGKQDIQCISPLIFNGEKSSHGLRFCFPEAFPMLYCCVMWPLESRLNLVTRAN